MQVVKFAQQELVFFVLQDASGSSTRHSRRLSCFLRRCGVSWSEEHVSLDCSECGGYSLQRPCPLCDGRCHTAWKRDLTMVSVAFTVLFLLRTNKINKLNDYDTNISHIDPWSAQYILHIHYYIISLCALIIKNMYLFSLQSHASGKARWIGECGLSCGPSLEESLVPALEKLRATSWTVSARAPPTNHAQDLIHHHPSNVTHHHCVRDQRKREIENVWMWTADDTRYVPVEGCWQRGKKEGCFGLSQFPLKIQSRIHIAPRYRGPTSSLSSLEVQSYTSTKDFYDVSEDNWKIYL